MELVAFLQERYEINVEDHDISPDNFESSASIGEFVKRKNARRDA